MERDEFLSRMVTQERAARAALALFPDEYSDGSNCQKEFGREGESCRICEAQSAAWLARVAQVRAAMIEAFR